MNGRAIVIALLGLAGCADLNWERAFYEGQRQSAEQCRLLRKPADPPCPTLLPYRQYENERGRAASGTASPGEAARP